MTLTSLEHDSLIAVTSSTEIVILKPALNSKGQWNEIACRSYLEQLARKIKACCELRFRLALGHYFPGDDSIARSYLTAQTTLFVGKQRCPEKYCYFYQDLILPVLLDGLKESWQLKELLHPLAHLKKIDRKGILLRSLTQWYKNDGQPQKTASALFIHRNTLEYRLNKVSQLTGLDLGQLDDRFLLYVAMQLDQRSMTLNE